MNVLPAKSKFLVFLIATANMLFSGAIVYSQELEEVVVTARKQSENLQSVPIAVSAFTENALLNRGVTNNAEIANFTPNVVFDTSSTFAGADTFQAFIRGVGQGDFALNTDPGVGLYVDSVYYARAPGAVIELLDIDRVEVLKGPQGTLFGRNSIGGAVSIVSRKPGEEFGFAGEITVGDHDRRGASAVVNVPLSDVLFSSIAFHATNRDGYQKRIPFEEIATVPTSTIPLDQLLVSDFSGSGGARDLGAKDNESFRGKLLWLASDTVEVTLSVDTTTIRDAANATTLLEVDPTAALGGLYNACIAGVPSLQALCESSAFHNFAAGQANLLYNEQFVTGDIDTTYATGANYSNIDSSGASVTIEWAFSGTLALKSISAYRQMESTFGLDIDGSPLVFDQTSFVMDTEQWSQEIQLNGSIGSRFLYTFGFYYFDEDGFQADRVPIADGLIQVAGGFDHDTEAKAFFGEANFDLTDALTLNFGVRFTEEEKTVQLDQQNLNPGFYLQQGAPPTIFPRQDDFTFLAPAAPLNETFDNTSIRAGVNWQVNDSLYTYFTYSQGFKSGGFTTRLTQPFNPAFIPANPGPEVLTQLDFDEETADTFELGVKSQFFDDRVRLNAAVFFNTYNDIQIVVQRGVSPSNENVAEAEIKGLELELEALLSNWFSVNASLGLLDAEYSEIQTTGNLTGRFGSITTETELVNTPELTGSLAINATFSESFSGNISFSYVDGLHNDVFNTPVLFQEAYTLLRASLRYEPPGGNWSAIFGVNNLTDERYIVSGFEAGALPFTTASYNRPREWYLTVSYAY